MTTETQTPTIDQSKRTDGGTKMTLQDAAEALGLTKARVRSISAASDSPIPSFKENMPGLGIKVSYVWSNDVAAYKTARADGKTGKQGAKGGNTRTPGFKAYVIKLSDEQHTALAPQFAEMGITLEDRYNYDPEKSKAYRELKKTKAIAEMTAAKQVTDGSAGQLNGIEAQQAELQASRVDNSVDADVLGDELEGSDDLTARLNALLDG